MGFWDWYREHNPVTVFILRAPSDEIPPFSSLERLRDYAQQQLPPGTYRVEAWGVDLPLEGRREDTVTVHVE